MTLPPFQAHSATSRAAAIDIQLTETTLSNRVMPAPPAWPRYFGAHQNHPPTSPRQKHQGYRNGSPSPFVHNPNQKENHMFDP